MPVETTAITKLRRERSEALHVVAVMKSSGVRFGILNMAMQRYTMADEQLDEALATQRPAPKPSALHKLVVTALVIFRIRNTSKRRSA